MALDDNELLRLAGYDTGDGRRLLHEHGEVYRAQLVAACWLKGYRTRRLSEAPPAAWSPDHEDPWDEAMRDVIAHLRQGDFVPGGQLYEYVQSGR
jgi:hypothetical protein